MVTYYSSHRKLTPPHTNPQLKGACPGLSVVESHADAPETSSFIIIYKWLGACMLKPESHIQLQHKLCSLGLFPTLSMLPFLHLLHRATLTQGYKRAYLLQLL